LGPKLPALIAAACLLTACASSQTSALSSPHPSGCHGGAPEAGVYNPDRLQVLDACRHASGTVVDVAREDDGDYHLWFTVDQGYEGLLNAEDHFQAKPAMLAEITPACPFATNPPDAVSAALCPPTTLTVPKIGDHIAIDGPWVLDNDHGWNEIHPVMAITIA
jgi:hypothetical protein